MVEYKFLTEEERQHFLEHGWLRIPNSIPKKYVDEWVENIWTRLGYDPNDPSTWTEEVIWMPRHREKLTKDFSPDAWQAMCELVGGEDKIDPVRSAYSGDQFIVNLGTEHWRTHDCDPKTVSSWHIDGDWYRHFLDSSEGALVIIQVYTDILPRGGGTYVCEDGTAGLCKFLYDRPEGSYNRAETGMYAHLQDCQKFLQFTAKAGDTILLHPFLPHVTGKNHLRQLRIIANPHVTLKEPFDLNRSNPEDYSLVEQVILKNLGRTSLPDWHITVPRERFYPRNYVAKFSRVQGELERLIKDAEAKGQSQDSVDTVYLKSEDAIRIHNIRNGFGDRMLEGQDGMMIKAK